MSLVFKSITLESILDPANMMLALKRVESNHGAPGVDGMRTDELRAYIFGHPGELSKAIKDGTYRPSPVKRVTIPKPEKGKYRELGIPTVTDRLVQQAVAQVLSLHFETIFSFYSCGFRERKGAHDAILTTISHTDAGCRWAVDLDLEKFFDTVDHSRLIRKLSRYIEDSRVISLIHRMLKSGISTQNGITPSTVGLMQGGPLSPLLANVYLDELDKELERRGHRFVRYADDIIVLVKSRRAAERTLQNLTKIIEGRMRLKVNRDKSTVAHITCGVKFLGHGFNFQKGGRIVPTIHAKSKRRLMDSVRKILRRNTGRAIGIVKRELREKLRGWTGYFKLAAGRSWVHETDMWIRRRIRQLIWKLWKKIGMRRKGLMALGCSREQAYMWACTRKSYWHTANSPIQEITMTNEVLRRHGWSWMAMFYKPLEWK